MPRSCSVAGRISLCGKTVNRKAMRSLHALVGLLKDDRARRGAEKSVVHLHAMAQRKQKYFDIAGNRTPGLSVLSHSESKGCIGWSDLLRIPSSGISRRVALVRTDVSEERMASVNKVTRIGELGT
jgi:hypothetical protein